jgi:alkyl hydroperoxide reductase subunit AhpC
MNDEERAYNLQEFAASPPTPINPGETMAARIGVMAPDFEAASLDGPPVRLGDLRGRRHVVIMTGAVTSPMCAFEIPAFNRLQDEFASREIAFFLLYTRESHPAEYYPSHGSWEQKLAHARALKRLENVRFPILVDGLDGKIHRSYGTWPNALFVIHKDGRLVFRSNIANHRELRQFLEDLIAADEAAAAGRVLHMLYSERIIPHEADQATHRRIYERAGPRAFEDYWAKRPHNRNRWP